MAEVLAGLVAGTDVDTDLVWEVAGRSWHRYSTGFPTGFRSRASDCAGKLGKTRIATQVWLLLHSGVQSPGATVGGKVGAIVGDAVGCHEVGETVTDADGLLVVGPLVGLVVGDTMWWGEAVGCDAVGDAVTDADGPLVVGGKLRGAIVVKSMD